MPKQSISSPLELISFQFDLLTKIKPPAWSANTDAANSVQRYDGA